VKRRAEKKKHRSPVAAFCSALGTVLLIIVVAACVPLTVPRLFGLQLYTVVSGSMEPSIPTGSLVYVEETEPEAVEAGEVIAFFGSVDSVSIITHRVVENRTLTGEFVTKGDANEKEDMNPVSYGQYIGEVVFSVPWLGNLAQAMTGGQGRAAAVVLILAAVGLHGAAAAVNRRGEREA
jgi:signal peptidase